MDEAARPRDPAARPRDPASKVVSREEAVRRAGPGRTFRLVFTNGCFDLLHRGHVECLRRARELGDALLVAVNGDASVRRLGKGPERPLVGERARAEVVAALECVDWVTLFGEDTPRELVAALQPDVLVKGGDYAEAAVAGAREVRARGGEVVVVPLLPGHSTSGLVARIQAARGGGGGGGGGGRSGLLLATRSGHKAREVRRILAGEGLGGRALVTLEEAGIPWSEEEEGLEPYDTFERNAESKARHFARLSGMATVADDSGLEVDALGGRPGVRTRRFAPPSRYPDLTQDEANNRHLLESLRGVPPRRRGARYVCAACLVDPRGDTVSIFRGEAPGRILTAARGDGGFGYDPLFLAPDLDRSYAELTPAEKDARSHRGQAFRALAAALAARE